MPDKNVQLPDGRIVAFPDSMSDDDIGTAIRKTTSVPGSIQVATPQNRATRRNLQAQGKTTPTPPEDNMLNAAKVGAGVAATLPIAGAAIDAAAPLVTSTAPLFAAASQKYEQVKQVVGDKAIQMSDELSDALQNVSRLGKSGGSIPKPASDLIDRVQDMAKNPEELSWQDLHDFSVNMTSKLAPDQIQKMNGPMTRAFGNLSRTVLDTLTKVADENGVGGTFTSARSMWANAAQLAEKQENAVQAAKDVGSMALKGGAAAAGGGALYGVYKTISDAFPK